MLTQPEGTVTFAGNPKEVYPGGEADEPSARARDVMDAFVATEGVGATKPAGIRIDRRRGYSSDFEPIGSERVPLFSTEGSTFHLEPDRTTRVVVGGPAGRRHDRHGDRAQRGLRVARHPRTADEAAGTIDWR